MEKLDIRNKADIDTNLPLISIIGRPNAGKSTLFNRLIGKRRAITDPTPGVTRDPIPERWLLGNNPVTLVDSGGVKLDKDGIDFAVTDKSLSLLDISTAIIFLMDCTEVTAEDMMLVERLRPYTDKVVLAVNLPLTRLMISTGRILSGISSHMVTSVLSESPQLTASG